MKVILADDIRGLGNRGETVTVKPGYARNFLFPQGIAWEATDANVRRLSEERRSTTRRRSAKRASPRKLREVEGATGGDLQKGATRTSLRLRDRFGDLLRPGGQGIE